MSTCVSSKDGSGNATWGYTPYKARVTTSSCKWMEHLLRSWNILHSEGFPQRSLSVWNDDAQVDILIGFRWSMCVVWWGVWRLSLWMGHCAVACATECPRACTDATSALCMPFDLLMNGQGPVGSSNLKVERRTPAGRIQNGDWQHKW